VDKGQGPAKAVAGERIDFESAAEQRGMHFFEIFSVDRKTI
jgi:hypothetical protein